MSRLKRAQCSHLLGETCAGLCLGATARHYSLRIVYYACVGTVIVGMVLGQAVQWLREQQVKNVGGPVGLSGGVGLVQAVRWVGWAAK